MKNALVINPGTPAEKAAPYLDEIDGILVMTVHPGYGGQKFIGECLGKVEVIRRLAPELDIMVDGGVNAETALLAVAAGANQLVAGSYLFAQKDMKGAVEEMRRRCDAAGARA
jgi:ribulose-phosphate 3-epimerase